MARGFNYAPGASAEVAEAGQPELDKDRLRLLADSRNALVREAIAARADCPFGLMAQLVHDHDARVRAAVAGNPRALGSVVGHLARDRHVEVLVALCGNPSTPREVLEGFVMHRKSEVRAAASDALDARAAGGAGAGEDLHTPELRDRVFEAAQERRAAPVSPIESPAPMPEPEPERVARVRTAPVRGFLPPVEG